MYVQSAKPVMFSATVESGLVETMLEKKRFQADSVALKMERHPDSLPHFLCSSWVADLVTVYGAVDHSQNYQIEFSRAKCGKVVSAIEDDFNFYSRAAWSPLSPSAHPHVLAANACTFDRSDVSQFEKSKWSSESISWLVSSLLSEP